MIDHKPSIILGLDPSSTVIGYGALTAGGQFVEGAIILPDSRGDGSFDRIIAMHGELVRLFERLRPSILLVEWTRGKVNTNRHGGLGAGLAVYGCGVGAAALAAWQWSQGHPECRMAAVCENDWTRGVPKKDRQLAIAAAHPEYGAHLGEDGGGDIADGIGLAAWWIQEQKVEKGLF
ncbi:hypothetical protein M0R72_14420 [Candidatus Pacearchaeota archaeon]|jgi:hypothetical protein|nr:hypothetical protein [Candidatus Pacearchaeota archaeon]